MYILRWHFSHKPTLTVRRLFPPGGGGVLVPPTGIPPPGQGARWGGFITILERVHLYLQSKKPLMAQKSNPTSLRLEKTNKRWDSIWYGDYYYTTQLLQGGQISGYVENVSIQGKFPPPVVFLTRGRQQVQIALFFPKAIATRGSRTGKRATERSGTAISSGDRLRRISRPPGGRFAHTMGNPGANNLPPGGQGNSRGRLSQKSGFKSWFQRGAAHSLPLPQPLQLNRLWAESIELSTPLSPINGVYSPSPLPVEAPLEPRGLLRAGFALRYLLLHFFAMHSRGGEILQGACGSGEINTTPGWGLSFGTFPGISLERGCGLLLEEMAQRGGGLQRHWGGISGGGDSRGAIHSRVAGDTPGNLGQDAPDFPKTRATTPFKDHLEWCIHRQLHSKCKIHFVMVHSPRQNPLFLASHIVSLLQEKMPFRRLKDQIIREITRGGGIKGIRITCSGRVASRSKKAQKAKKESIQWGETGLHVFSSLLSFASKTAYTSFGKIGVKVWICYG